MLLLSPAAAAGTANLDGDEEITTWQPGVRETQTGVKYDRPVSCVVLNGTAKDGEGGVISHMPLVGSAEIYTLRGHTQFQGHNKTGRKPDSVQNNRGSVVSG